MAEQKTVSFNEILNRMHTPQIHIDPRQARALAETGIKVLEIFLMALDAYESEQEKKG